MRRVQRWGLAPAVYDLCYRRLNRLIGYRALLGVVTPMDALRYTEEDRFPAGYTAEAVSVEQLRHCASDPLLDLTSDFIDAFSKRGDWCLGVFRGGRLVSYSFYSRVPVPIDAEWTITYDPRFTYVYKCFTVVSERGKRLSALAMTAAARRGAEEDGRMGLIAYVEANQYASLHSGERMGHRQFGVVRLLDCFGVRRSWRTRGCDEYGFDVKVSPLPTIAGA